MKRCTEWRGEHAAVALHNVNYIDRLAQYEDTGLEPDEIQEAVDLLNFDGADITQELKSWVERCTWHVRKCNELRTELDKAMGEIEKMKTEMTEESQAEGARARLIDAESLYERVYAVIVNLDDLAEVPDLRQALKIIDSAPTVSAPERHGYWIWRDSCWAEGGKVATCSLCKESLSILGQKLKYCPNCGAKMDGCREQKKQKASEPETKAEMNGGVMT